VTAQTYIKGTTSVQISRSIEQAIRDRRLRAGDGMPTVRALAERLAVSPATVAAAYKELRTRGILTAHGRRGTAVSHGPTIGGRPPTAVPEGARNLAHGNPDARLLPPLGPALRSIDSSHVLYGSDLKDPALIKLAVRDLARDSVTTESVAVVSGGMDGIERVLSAHLRPGDRVVVEDPGFTSVIDLVAALGMRPVPCPVDDAGMIPEALEVALASCVHAVVVTPRAQNPTGAFMDAARARRLRRILKLHPEVLCIEDDHASWVAGVPLHALSAEPQPRWAFVRTLSKSFGPDLRLALVAGDEETIARIEGRQLTGMRWVSRILQRIAVAVWNDRATAASLRAAAREYAERRNALLAALASRGIEAHGRSGLNVWVPVRDEASVVEALLARGWAVTAGARFRIRSAEGVRITVSTLEKHEAEELAEALADATRRTRHAASA